MRRIRELSSFSFVAIDVFHPYLLAPAFATRSRFLEQINPKINFKTCEVNERPPTYVYGEEQRRHEPYPSCTYCH
jgi:hypothetical protein